MSPKPGTDTDDQAGDRSLRAMVELVEALALPAIVWSRDRRVVHANTALERRFGGAFRRALRGSSASEVGRLVAAFDDSGGAGERIRVVVEGEVLFVAPVVVIGDPARAYCATAYVDQTSLAAHDAEHADRASSMALDALSGELARELNNLVTALVGVSDAIETLEISDRRAAITDDLGSVIDLCLDISTTLRTAQPFAAQVDPVARFDPVPMLERVARLHRCADVGVTVEAVPGVRIECCPKALERALRNATRNGVRAAGSAASEGSQGRVLLTLSEVPEAGKLRFTVEDDGAGFVTGFHREGAGLAQIRRFARTAGGRVEIDASTLGGASLLLELPAAEPEEQARSS